MSDREDALKSLEPLFERAKREGLWFFCSYQAMWFSPKELRQAHSEGRFIWGAANWELRNPNDLVKEAEVEARSAESRLKSIKEKVSQDPQARG